MKCRTVVWVAVAWLAGLPAKAGTVALDQASDPAYAGGWFDQGNGGSGWNPWIFGSAATGNVFVGFTAGNGGATSIETEGLAFNLLDQGAAGNFIDVFRFLEDDLAVGNSFSVELDVNFRGGYKGIRIRGADDTSSIFRFEVGNPGSGDDYLVLDAATGNGSVGSTYSSDTVFLIALTQTTTTGGLWQVTRRGGVTSTNEGAYNGRVSSIQLYTFLAGSAPEQMIQFNTLQVMSPDAPRAASLGLGLGGVSVTWNDTLAGLAYAMDRSFDLTLPDGGWVEVDTEVAGGSATTLFDPDIPVPARAVYRLRESP